MHVRPVLVGTILVGALVAVARAHAQQPVPAPAPPTQKPATPGTVTAEAAAWTVAETLKKQAAYERAAPLFEDFAETYPESPRAQEANVEAGVCWFSIGRARQPLQRNTPASLEAFTKALGFFDKVARDHPESPVAGRAQYMRGTVKMFSGDLAASEAEYTLALEKYAADPKYGPKSLERRAAARRGLLKTKEAAQDLELYMRKYPTGEEINAVKQYLAFVSTFERPAPALDAEVWIQGDPVSLAAFKGDVVILYFFASWCENCEKGRPAFLDLVSRYEPMGVHFVGVVNHSTDPSKDQTADIVRPWLATKKMSLPVLLDRGGTTRAYLGQKIPDMVLIDRAGRVRWHDNPANLQDATIEALLVEDPAVITGPHK